MSCAYVMAKPERASSFSDLSSEKEGEWSRRVVDWLGLTVCFEGPEEESWVANEFYQFSCDDELPLEHLGDFLSALFDHVFTKRELVKLARRTSAGRSSKASALDDHAGSGGWTGVFSRAAPPPRVALSFDECEYVANLCRRKLGLAFRDPKKHAFFEE